MNRNPNYQIFITWIIPSSLIYPFISSMIEDTRSSSGCVVVKPIEVVLRSSGKGDSTASSEPLPKISSYSSHRKRFEDVPRRKFHKRGQGSGRLTRSLFSVDSKIRS